MKIRRSIKRLALVGTIGTLGVMLIYGVLVYYPTGYDRSRPERERAAAEVARLMQPAAAPEPDAMELLMAPNGLAIPHGAGLDPGRPDGDTPTQIERLEQLASRHWFRDVGMITVATCYLPASWFGSPSTTAPLTIPPELTRRIVESVGPQLGRGRTWMSEVANSKFCFPSDDHTTAALHNALDRAEAILLDRLPAYPAFREFPTREMHIGFQTLALLAIERAALRETSLWPIQPTERVGEQPIPIDRGRARAMLRRYLDHQRIQHLGQFPPYGAWGPLTHCAWMLLALGEAPGWSDEDWLGIQPVIEGLRLSPEQLRELRQAYGDRLCDTWTQGLNELRVKQEPTLWRKLSRQYPAAAFMTVSRPVIRTQLRHYAVAAARDPEARRWAKRRVLACLEIPYHFEMDGALESSIEWNDFYSWKPNASDADVNAGADLNQLVLAAVRYRGATGEYPESLDALAPWLGGAQAPEPGCGWAVAVRPPGPAIAYLGHWNASHREPDAIDRAMTRYHDAHDRWPATPAELEPYLERASDRTLLNERAMEFPQIPLFIFFERKNWSMRTWYDGFDENLFCLTRAEREALRARFDRGQRRMEFVQCTLFFPQRPLITESMLKMLSVSTADMALREP